MIRISFTVLLFVSIFFLNCKKDPDTKSEKIILYQLLCPNGITACYDQCANTSGFSDGQTTGTEYYAFKSCTSNCDAFCSLSFLFISDN